MSNGLGVLVTASQTHWQDADLAAGPPAFWEVWNTAGLPIKTAQKGLHRWPICGYGSSQVSEYSGKASLQNYDDLKLHIIISKREQA